MTERERIISALKYFSPINDKNIDWDKVDLDSIVRLDHARDIAGVALFITSNHRTPDHSVKVGGLKTDAHTEEPCTAFDIRCKRVDGRWDSQKAFKVIPALVKAGFNRIGLNNKNMHIHADRSSSLPQDVFFIE